MRRLVLFCEDSALEKVVGSLVERMAADHGIEVEIIKRSVAGGHGTVVREFRNFAKDVRGSSPDLPDLVVVATDVNCKGRATRVRELNSCGPFQFPVVFALPDPHVERWLLLDGAAFKEVVGTGCDAPDLKCERSRYKDLLDAAVWQAGIEPILGGLEFAQDLVQAMDLQRAGRIDSALKQFTDELGRHLRDWQR